MYASAHVDGSQSSGQGKACCWQQCCLRALTWPAWLWSHSVAKPNLAAQQAAGLAACLDTEMLVAPSRYGSGWWFD